MASEMNYPANIADGESAVAFMRFDVMQRVNARAHSYVGGVNIYMPETLQLQQTSNYDGVSLGAGGADAFGDDFGAGIWANIKSSYSNLTAGMSAKLSGGSSASGQQINSYNTKTIKNPHMKMLYRQTDYRNFEFSFKFTPKNAADCSTIISIVNTFRKYMLPTGDMHESYKLGYPAEFEIMAKYKGGAHPWLPKYKRAVCTDVSVNYAGAGMFAQMENGFPAETHMTIQFTEIELLAQQDVSLSGSSY